MNDSALAAKAQTLFDEFYDASRQERLRWQDNERFWRGEHWMGENQENAPQPVTPVLFSTVENMLGDMMDNFPEALLIGEEPGDSALADELTAMISGLLSRRGYRSVWRDKCRQALKFGCSVQEVFWDPTLFGGLGDIGVRAVDVRRFVWDPVFENIEDGRACFQFAYYPRAWFEARWPEKAAQLAAGERVYEQEAAKPYARSSSDGDILLLEYWYKTYDAGVAQVHMARIAGGVVLEDSRKHHTMGLFASGQYPFLMEAVYPVSGSPAGLGIIDILKNLQRYADQMDAIIMKNALMSGKLKLLINRNADIDEDALTDWDREVVRAARIDESAVRWFQAAPLNPVVYSHHQQKLMAIKEESGQSSFNRGETGYGVTAAAAIVALQEAGSKRSRTIIDQMYDGFARVVKKIIALMAENYTEARIVRLRGDSQPHSIDAEMLKRGDGLVELDVRVYVQRQVPYRTLYQNELAMQLLKTGIIDEDGALEMMQFEGREAVVKRRQTALLKKEQERMKEEALA